MALRTAFYRWLLLLACAGVGACFQNLDSLTGGGLAEPADDSGAGDASDGSAGEGHADGDASTERPAAEGGAPGKPQPEASNDTGFNDSAGDTPVIDSPPPEAAPPVCMPSSPPTEVCNGKDDDCNGVIDDGCPRGPVWPTATARTSLGESMGGGAFSDTCASDELLVGLRVAAAGYVTQVRGVCRKYVVRPSPSGDLAGASLLAGAVRDLPPHPATTPDPVRDLVCPEPAILVGIKLTQQNSLAGGVPVVITPSISALCAAPTFNASPVPRVEWQSTTEIGPVAGSYARAADRVTTDHVATPTVLVGVHGFAGSWTDRVGVLSGVYGMSYCAGSATPGADPFNRANWMASASVTSDVVPRDIITNAYDASPTTRWSTGQSQIGDEWFKLDVGAVGCIGRVSLTAPAGDGPAEYELAVSTDDQSYTPVASGHGQTAMVIDFASHDLRYIRVSQTGMRSTWWSISDIAVQK